MDTGEDQTSTGYEPGRRAVSLPFSGQVEHWAEWAFKLHSLAGVQGMSELLVAEGDEDTEARLKHTK